MLTEQEGEGACREIEEWANRVIRGSGENADARVYFDPDSSTYILRLSQDARVLVFRLSAAQVRGAGRESECERTLQRKLKDLGHLI